MGRVEKNIEAIRQNNPVTTELKIKDAMMVILSGFTSNGFLNKIPNYQISNLYPIPLIVLIESSPSFSRILRI